MSKCYKAYEEWSNNLCDSPDEDEIFKAGWERCREEILKTISQPMSVPDLYTFLGE